MDSISVNSLALVLEFSRVKERRNVSCVSRRSKEAFDLSREKCSSMALHRIALERREFWEFPEILDDGQTIADCMPERYNFTRMYRYLAYQDDAAEERYDKSDLHRPPTVRARPRLTVRRGAVLNFLEGMNSSVRSFQTIGGYLKYLGDREYLGVMRERIASNNDTLRLDTVAYDYENIWRCHRDPNFLSRCGDLERQRVDYRGPRYHRGSTYFVGGSHGRRMIFVP